MEKTYYNDMMEFLEGEIRRKEQVRMQWTGKMSRETEAEMVAEILNYEIIKDFVRKEIPAPVKEIAGKFYCPRCGALIDDTIENYCTVCGKHLLPIE